MKIDSMIMLISTALLVACSPAPTSDINEQANDLLELARENPVDVSDATWRGKGTLMCRPATKNICTQRGCESGPAEVWSKVTPSSGDYRRCDRKGCDAYRTEVTHSGIWTTLARPENSLLFKVTASGRYVEVASTGDTVIVYHGACTAN